MTIATLLFALIALPTNGAGAGEPLMLDFTASWCGPCQQMRPTVEGLVRKGYPIKPVDLDANRALAERYEVTGVPTFVVIDPADGRELGRLEGARPAADLATLYNEARAKFRPQAPADDRDDAPAPAEGRKVRTRLEPDGEDETASPSAAAASPNPKPWETVVRIKVHGAGTIGFGSGTVIHSTPDEAIVLTCAHIFHLENGPQAAPSRFPRKITVDLFDGNLSGPQRNQVHYTQETLVGEAIDYDFNRDVGLIRIRPGRRIAAARVVPAHWKPKSRMGMVTVGCSEGHDATAWNTVIVNPAFRGLAGKNSYEAIECMTAPKQGRSGGGLFTSDGFVAGVCDFAEPQGNHGLYASPRSIYQILDRNDMVALYAPGRGRPETLLAKNRPAPRRTAPTVTRAQSPDRDDPGAVTLPPPEMIGIRPPVAARDGARAASRQRGTWHPTPAAAPADLNMDASADPDRFGTVEPAAGSDATAEADEPQAPPPSPRKAPAGKWKAGHSPLPELATAGTR